MGKKNGWGSLRSLVFAVGVLGIAALVCFGCYQETSVESRRTPPSPPAPTEPEPVAVVVDIPSLVGKSIDEIRGVLGTPEDSEPEPTAQQVQLGVDEWNNTFTKDGQEILVTFNPVTRQVVDVFLVGRDKTELMQKGGLKEGASAYRIEPVKQLSDPSEITGIKVIPAG